MVSKALAMLKCNDPDLCHAAAGLVTQFFHVSPVKKLRQKADAASPERTTAATSKSPPGRGTPAKTSPSTRGKAAAATPASTVKK